MRSRALLGSLLLVLLTSACMTPTQSANLSPATPSSLSGSPAPTSPSSTQSAAARTAEISDVSNDVKSRIKTEAGYEAARDGDQIQVGGGVRTGNDSRVRLDTSEGSIIRIASDTEFQLLDFSPQVADPVTKLSLSAGTLWIWVTKALGNGSLEIDTPSGVATVRGSLMSVEYQPATRRMIVTCLEGQCRLTATTGQWVDLRADQFSEISESGQPPAPASPMSALQLAEWKDNFPEVSNVVATVTALPQPSLAPRLTSTPTPSLTESASASPTPNSPPLAVNCNLRSVSGTQVATITFVNQSSRAVRVYWLNYKGQEVFYSQLASGQSYSQPTYLTHPWCVRDASSGEAVFAITATEKTQTAVIP
jgi:hypothetical protein